MKEDRAKSVDALKKQGVTFTTLPAADRAKWASMAPDSPAQLAETMEKAGLPGYALVEKYQDVTTALGYKWDRQWGIKK